MLNYIFWNVSPEMFTSGNFSIRWYGALFAVSFLLGYYVLSRIFSKEGLAPKLVDKLTIYVFLGTIIGLRLGHCLFYEPSYYLAHPLEILKVWKGGLASHGAAIGILIALFLFARKTKKNYLWLLDRIVIIVILVGTFIRVGNLMNSEIIGAPTSSKHAFLFVNAFDRSLTHSEPELIHYTKLKQTGEDTVVDGVTLTKLNAEIGFEAKKIDNKSITAFLNEQVFPAVKTDEDLRENFKLLQQPDVSFKKNPKTLIAAFEIYAIPRHPSQIYESASYFIMFLIMLWLYRKKRATMPNGYLFSIFLIMLWSFRFIIEYFKEAQVPFEHSLPLFMGQLLSIPFIILGVVMLVLVLRNKKKQTL